MVCFHRPHLHPGLGYLCCLHLHPENWWPIIKKLLTPSFYSMTSSKNSSKQHTQESSLKIQCSRKSANVSISLLQTRRMLKLVPCLYRAQENRVVIMCPSKWTYKRSHPFGNRKTMHQLLFNYHTAWRFCFH